MTLGIREKSKVNSENGSDRRLSCRSPTENGNELSKARMSIRRVPGRLPLAQVPLGHSAQQALGENLEQRAGGMG
jgi:hypothetical protein